MQYSKDQRSESVERIKQWLDPEKPTVYVNVTKVAPSGMSRRMKAYVVKDGQILDATWNVARVMELPLNDDGVRVNGCGMDMTFHLVYELSQRVFRDGYTITKMNL